jgi:hypothetical protein
MCTLKPPVHTGGYSYIATFVAIPIKFHLSQSPGWTGRAPSLNYNVLVQRRPLIPLRCNQRLFYYLSDMKLYVKIALFAVMFIAVAAILAALYLFSMTHSDIKKAKPDFEITATQLQKEFDYDETKASIKYINKIVEVTGTIASIKPEENNSLNISLATENRISSVICTCPAIRDISEYKPGDKVTIRGICSGYLMDVLLNNCAVIEDKNQK